MLESVPTARATPAMPTDPLPTLPVAIRAIDRWVASCGPVDPGRVEIPRRVFQFWDRQPPAQIQTLLERNRALCQEHGIEHLLFDEHSARDYLAAQDLPAVIEAYDLAAHPAMKCDVFRLAFLTQSGGVYVDADIVFRPRFMTMFELSGRAAVFKWDTEGRTNVCNWLVGAVPGHPAMRLALGATVLSVTNACRDDPASALKNILGVSGPGIFTRALGGWLIGPGAQAAAADLNVQTVTTAHTIIQNGPGYLKEPLEYKSDSRHWLAASREETPVTASETAIEPPPNDIAPPVVARGVSAWLRRLIG